MLRLLAFLALFIAAPAAASDLDGAWDLKSGRTIIFRLTVHGSWATWIHPRTFDSDGDGFSHVTGPAHVETTRDVHVVAGDLELTFQDPAPDSSPAVLRLHKVADGKVTMSLVGMGLEPFDLTRAAAGTAPGPWDHARHYALIRPRPTNARMTAIFDADQDARKPDRIDWKIVAPADAERRRETQALLDAGGLQSGDDFFHAAFVFQHGHAPDDFLKAHLLAMVAIARGRSDAVWIASATLDRYLQTIKQPQVLGTQFAIRDGKADQEPFNRDLISDALRRALKVPTLADQVAQGKGFEARDARGKAAAAQSAP
jgi:hypothetical protein